MIGKSLSNSRLGFHILAAFTVLVWGTTFVSTKLLIVGGLSPAAIFLYRFIIAYIGICFFAPRRLWASTWKDEVLFVLLGLTGGSLYFLSENSALSYTLASNVALIISTTPILTALINRLCYPDNKLNRFFAIGSFMALAGVAMVVFNGSFIMQMNPLGDLLTLFAALMCALYSLLVKRMNDRYPVLFVTRKVFFYGLLTILPYFLVQPLHFDIDILLQPIILSNLLFLAILGSLICYTIWNFVIERLGIVTATNYIYFIPAVTLFTSAIVIDEHITWVALLGAVMIISGVYFASKR